MFNNERAYKQGFRDGIQEVYNMLEKLKFQVPQSRVAHPNDPELSEEQKAEADKIFKKATSMIRKEFNKYRITVETEKYSIYIKVEQRRPEIEVRFYIETPTSRMWFEVDGNVCISYKAMIEAIKEKIGFEPEF